MGDQELADKSNMFTALCLTLLLLSPLYASAAAVSACKNDSYGHYCCQAESLLALKSHMIDQIGFLSSWVPRDNDTCLFVCQWAGVTCNEVGSVVSLDLSGKNLSGTVSADIANLHALVYLNLSVNAFAGELPSTIADLVALRYLNISNNGFSGFFPAAGFQLLEVLDCYNNNLSGHLPFSTGFLPSHLRWLHLGGNYFEGAIPSQYGDLRNLTYLALPGNSLSGKIPPNLGNLTQLQYLYLGYFNRFEGGIPSELGRLHNLIRLDMASCGLSGAIPSELGSLQKLDSLFLHLNDLTGAIPSHIGNLTSLKSLDLSMNHLVGEVPAEFCHLWRLELLSLFHNHINGTILPSLTNLPRLQVLYLWANNMSGKVPPNLGLNGRLLKLDLSSNSFTGPIPPYLCVGGRLQHLILFHNQFSGPIPDSLARCPTLERVRLGQNRLSGSLPPSFFILPRLEILEAPENLLGGTLPDIPAGSCLRLGRLDLSNNCLSGIIPTSIHNLVGLQALLLPGNNLEGGIPFQISNLKALATLDLHSNGLTGFIPPGIHKCKKLAILDLSHNKFTGKIPSAIGDLSGLDFLNVSDNHLSGNIPFSLENIESLTAADFSFNNLSGPIPSRGQFAGFMPSFFDGNPRLCGSKLMKPCNSSGSSPELSRYFNNMEPIIAVWISFGIFFSLTCVIFLGALYFNRKAPLSILLGSNPGNGKKPWKLIAFQQLDFNVTDILACLSVGNIIGKGGTGIVYKGTMPSGQIVVVKWLPDINCSKGLKFEGHGLSEEIKTLGNIRHEHIVKLLGFCSNQEAYLLIYEYMPNGSLAEVLHGFQTVQRNLLDWPTRYKIAIEAAEGLCYLHHDCTPLIVHRDVKSNNILLDASFKVHVTDIGLAKFLREESTSAIAGSYGYIAPEYTDTLKVSEKSDVYSFGVVLLELLTGRRLVELEYAEDGANDIVEWVKMKIQTLVKRRILLEILDPRICLGNLVEEGEEGDAMQIMQEMTLLLNVALHCIQDLPMQRPTMREVVQMLTERTKNSTSL